MKILVLTSRENFVWHSMQEIIPYIESVWLNTNSEQYQVKLVNVDETSLPEITQVALECEHVVLTCFNFKICKVAEFIRFKLNLSVKFITYVHNMATIAFWPFRKFARDDFFRHDDIFVTSCENDQNTINAVFKSPKTLLSPFFYESPDLSFLNKKNEAPLKLVYVGRISSQKNLHNLISAYGILSDSQKLPKLYIFGKEDYLGSPNMGFKDISYQKDLNDLIHKLNLKNDIEFKGHQPRHEINKFLSENRCLSLSVSLHSDENFGMALLQSLILGNSALISDWGGHSDFKNHFKDRVFLIPVSETSNGPALGPEEIANYMKTALQSVETHNSDIEYTDFYKMSRQVSRNESILHPAVSYAPLLFSELAEQIYRQKTELFAGHPTQIFKNYQDPLFLKISGYYIGNFSKSVKNQNFV